MPFKDRSMKNTFAETGETGVMNAFIKIELNDFTLDFQNDCDIIGHQILAMGFLADQITVMQHYMNLLNPVE